jgi:hypothetical protein
VYAVSAAIGCAVVLIAGSPWVAAKALAIASPAFLLLGLAGIYVLRRRGRAVEAGVVALAVAGGVLWSNALGYGGVNLGPRERFAELEEIGERFAGDGPALMTEFEPFGVRHFLAGLDPEGASEFRRRPVPLRDGRLLAKRETADVDEIQLQALLLYRTLVLRRSPTASRPPSPYALVAVGDWYEVWQRPPGATATVLEHLPLGGPYDPGAVPPCEEVRRLAALAPEGRLAAVQRPPVAVVDLSQAPSRPPEWAASATPGAVDPEGSGTLTVSLDLRVSGTYTLWIGGGFKGALAARLDGEPLGRARHALSHGGQYVELGRRALAAGPHRVELELSGADLHPGSRGRPRPLGPLALTTATADLPVLSVPPERAESLCGRRLDWIEALAR